MLLIPGILASKFTPQGDFESIATVTVGSGGSATITFSSIPATYQHLQIRGLAKDSGATYGTGLNAYVRFNSDSASNYRYHNLRGQGASVISQDSGAAAQMYVSYYPGSLSNTSSFGVTVIDVLDYADTNKFKTVRCLSGDDLNGSGTVGFSSGLWRSTSAVSTITLTTNDVSFAQYSHFALYGIKG
jgi:hypothetical protein